MSNCLMSVEQIKEALPDKFRKSVNQELVDEINTLLADPDMYEQFRDNLVSYTQVLTEGKFKLTDYVNAVKYVSYRLMNMTQLDAYRRTFPDKYQRFIAKGVLPKDISSYVHAYNKSKLVNLIMAQTMVPFHVLNQDLRQKALNVQVELMMSAKSEKVRSDAANSVLTHLKPPEVQKVELDIGVKESSAIADLRESTMALVAQQRTALQAGVMTAKDLAEAKLVKGTTYDHEG